MFDLLKKAIGGFVQSIGKKVEEATKKTGGKPKEAKKIKKPPEAAPKVTHERAKETTKKKFEILPKTVEPRVKPTARETITDKIKKTFELGVRRVTHETITSEMLNEPLDQLVISLIEANVAMEVAEEIATELKKRLNGKEVGRGKLQEVVRKEIHQVLIEKLNQRLDPQALLQKKPMVIAVTGINGSGKTTSVAKLAAWYQRKGRSVVVAAADTYRAAAIEQLQKHMDTLGVKMIKHGYGADAAAVCFDAIQHAKAHGIDAVIIDTAGRMHAAKPLMEELEKIIRVARPDLVLLVIDSLVGNDAVEQLDMFRAIKVDGVILSKSDLDNKGGAALTITSKGTPVAFLGTGQKYTDWESYDPEEFLKKIAG